ncbi:MAG TPA: DUF2281 domain-containing protein [Pirellulales bacterium]|nr:DUF2281 domain-containing protein [Pirellulales bacterium]
MTVVSVQEAQAKLRDLIRGLAPGEELVITEDESPIARLVASARPQSVRKLGGMRGTVLYLAPDFDAPLDDFKEYGITRVW